MNTSGVLNNWQYSTEDSINGKDSENWNSAASCIK